MKSNFDKTTSEGYYSFDKNDVFEALAMWCAKKGISLKDRHTTHFGCSGDPHFVVEMFFNDRKQN